MTANYLYSVGYEVKFNSKNGGGSYVVVGHVNCSRCNSVIEDREWTSPSRKHRNKGRYFSRYTWCWSCGLYTPDINSKEIILD